MPTLPVKLLYITNGIDGPGGLERVLSIKASYLAEHMNYEVHIANLFEPVDDLFYQFSPRIHMHYLRVNTRLPAYPFSFVSRIRSIINKIDPNIVLVCDDGLKGLLLPILIRFNRPKIYERHVSKQAEIQTDKISLIKRIISSVKFRLMNYGASRYDAFVVLTEGNKNEWPLRNIHVIPNPLSFFPSESDLSKLDQPTIIAVGKQSFQKGYDHLLKAWEIVNRKNNTWKLEIYGKKNPKLGLESLSKKLGIDDSVTFYDPVKDIAQKYKNASICAMSSRYEGFGMVLTEAMSYGLPCVSFDCPYGPSDIIGHRSNGLLVKNGDTSGLADAILEIIEDNSKRKRLGENARNNVNKYLPEQICKKWDELFKELLEKS